MSTKTTKRKQKRLNTDEENEITDKSESPKKNDEILKETTEKETETTENNIETTEEQNGHTIEENGKTEENVDEKIIIIEENVTNGEKIETIENIEKETIIVVDSDNELDVQLSVDDLPEEKTGMTTRSHKNSPKTETVTNEVRINVTRLEDEPILTETNQKELINTEKTTEEKITEEKSTEIIEIEDKDTTNASIFVNYGDETRNDDITTINEDSITSFVEINKDLSYGQALRTLSGRRTLRRDSPYVTRFTKAPLDVTDSRKSYIPHISSVKRKHASEIPDEPKRFKSDDSTGLFSYISSPITNFRNRISRSDVPSSTPKLTAYKYGQGNNIIDDMSKIELEEKNERKWCSIM